MQRYPICPECQSNLIPDVDTQDGITITTYPTTCPTCGLSFADDGVDEYVPVDVGSLALENATGLLSAIGAARTATRTRSRGTIRDTLDALDGLLREPCGASARVGARALVRRLMTLAPQ